MDADDLRAAVAQAHRGVQVEVIETHISWVFLAGDRAYKVKKPVDLGFADFSTLQRRRFCCEEELRLNRRLAEDVYLDVLPVTMTADGPLLGGEGEAAEFAVRMNRFPQQAILTNALAAGTVTPQMIDTLAVDVAGFHEQSPVAGDATTWGEPGGVAERVGHVFAEVKRIANRLDRANEVQSLRHWLDDQFAALEATFRRRKQLGKVHEVHGDLHSGNMVLLNGRIVVFDCIDFNPDLRWIDVLSDAAFAVMDLEHRGRRDLAHRFLNTYLEQTGDYEGLSVLRYYLVYRALVRAAVTGIRLRQEETEATNDHETSPDVADQRREVQRYVDLAADYSRREAAFLSIMHGPSGSGKSTWARRLAEEFGAIQLRSDVVRKRRYPNSTDRYSPDATRWTYQRLFELARVTIESGFSVVLDATFLTRAPRKEVANLARQLGVPFVIVEMRTPRERLFERVARRAVQGLDASEATTEVLRRQLAALEPLHDEEQPCAVVFDTEIEDAGSEMFDNMRRRLANSGGDGA